MPSAHGAHIKYAWQHQADMAINQVNPVSGTPYTVLAATEDVRIISIEADVFWTVQPTPLEVHVTVDGQLLDFTAVNPVSGTAYYAGSQGAIVGGILAAADLGTDRSFLVEGHNIAVTAETTGGTVQNLECRVKWARLLPT